MHQLLQVGSLVFIGLLSMNIDITTAAVSAGTGIFVIRLFAIYYQISLPKFRFKR